MRSELRATPPHERRPARRRAQLHATICSPACSIMLALGFSSGLPFLLVGNTFGYWLRDEGTSLTAIGFMSWVGIAYSLKFLWAPILDRVDAPRFCASGAPARLDAAGADCRRASACSRWPAWASATDWSCWARWRWWSAFASATQDIAIDAWRIETRRQRRRARLLTSAYHFGYRVRAAGDRRADPGRRRTSRLERHPMCFTASLMIDRHRRDALRDANRSGPTPSIERKSGRRRCGPRAASSTPSSGPSSSSSRPMAALRC